MSKVTVIIPSRNEPNLKKTVDDLFVKATGEIEVIVMLDGETVHPLPTERPEVILVKNEDIGKYREMITKAGKMATGEYLMKIDAHVAMSPGFDEEFKKNHLENNWVSVPRRYDLDLETWTPKLETKVDYYYLSCPWGHGEPFMMRDMRWYTGKEDKDDILIDDLMTFGGTCWFLTKDYFINILGGLQTEGYGIFIKEAQELALKTWLGGGRVIINKNVWCAHYGQPLNKHPYPVAQEAIDEHTKGAVYSAHYWTENKWKDRVHDFDWLIEKFSPLPRPKHKCNREMYSWAVDWRYYYNKANE